MSKDTTINDTSADKKYFILTPQIVWALARDTYDYTLWDTIKMIAGDHGECTLSTEDLALLSMMSVGKVVDCRTYLLAQHLLEGELIRDPGYPQPVWHLRVPDLWRRNIEWRSSFHSLDARMDLKRQQKEAKKSLHQMKAVKEPSSGEEGTPPDEGYPSPDEAKKNHEEEPKEELWKTILKELKLQTTRPTFDRYLAPTRLMECDNGTWTIACQNAAARDWLDARLRGVIERTIAHYGGQAVELVVEEAQT